MAEEEIKKEDKGRLVSPKEMMEAGKDIMLGGRDPTTKLDWIRLFNFFSANICKGLEEYICLLMGKLYNVPLTEDEIMQIALFHMKEKKEEKEKF